MNQVLTDRIALIDADRKRKKILLNAYISEIKKRSIHPLWVYEPAHEEALSYHKTEGTYRAIFGGNQSGKTRAFIIDLLWDFLDIHPYRMAHGKKKTGWIVARNRITYVDTVLMPYLLELTPPQEIESIGKYTLKLKIGAVIFLKSCESGEDDFMSAAVHRIGFDEEPPKKIYDKCMPRLWAKNGSCDLVMTPENGDSTWVYSDVYEPYLNGNPRYKVWHFNTTKNKFISKEVLEEKRKDYTTDDNQMQMRMYGAFISQSSQCVFTLPCREKVRATLLPPAWCGDIFVKDGKASYIEDTSDNKKDAPLKFWKTPKPGKFYFMGGDTSEGMRDSADFSGYEVTENGLEQIMEYDKVIAPEYLDEVYAALGKLYNDAFLNIERNNTGGTVIGHVARSGYTNIYRRVVDKGFYASIDSTSLGSDTTSNKMLIMGRIETEIMNDRLIIRSERLFKQMDAYIVDAKRKIRAGHGKDDAVMALAVMLTGYDSGQYYEAQKYIETQKEINHRKLLYGEGKPNEEKELTREELRKKYTVNRGGRQGFIQV